MGANRKSKLGGRVCPATTFTRATAHTQRVKEETHRSAAPARHFPKTENLVSISLQNRARKEKTENTERPHFPNVQKMRFRFLAGRKRKRPHPAPRGAGRETQRRLRKCKLEEGWTGEGGWAHAKRKQRQKISHDMNTTTGKNTK